MLKEQIIGFGTLTVVVASLILRASVKVLVTMAVLWLTGALWPYAAHALGIPQKTVYAFVMSLFSTLTNVSR